MNELEMKGVSGNGRLSIFKTMVATLAVVVLAATNMVVPTVVSAETDAISPVSPSISISTELVKAGFSSPIFVTHAGDARLFVAEQSGIVKIIKDGQILPTPFLSITTDVRCCGEEGLLGLAFEPNYKTTGRFYVYHTVLRDGYSDEVIARYQVSANPDAANPSSRQEVLYIPHRGIVNGSEEDNGNHNGGWIGFGPDSLLYAGVGDGGSGGDPFCAGQNANTLLGKILRLNVVGQITYTVPATNAFTSPQKPEVWAFGLRNPWRSSFDRQTGDLYIGDVGQGEREEISLAPAGVTGLNFGWNRFEGNRTYGNSCPASAISVTMPITDYTHSVGTSVTGGYVYRGAQYPWLSGVYFYADFGSGRLFGAWRAGNTGPFSTASVISNVGFNVSSFGEDANGELYIVDYGGKIYRLKSTFRGKQTFLPAASR